MITPGVSARDLSPMMSPREDEKDDHGGVGDGDVAEGIEHGAIPIGKSMNKTIGRIPIIGTSLTGPRGRGLPSGPQPKTFRQRFRDDREFRSSFCRFADRCCLLTTFIVYTGMMHWTLSFLRVGQSPAIAPSHLLTRARHSLLHRHLHGEQRVGPLWFTGHE